MYINVRRYETHPDRINDIIGKIEKGFVPLLKKQPGFVSYEVSVVGQGVLVTISKFKNQEEAKASRDIAAAWVAENAKEDFPNKPIVMAGEVKLAS